MSARRELPGALALAAGGAAVTLLAAGQPWAHALIAEGPLRLTVHPSGRVVAPAVPAFGLVGLAGAAAVLATRRSGRLLTGAVLLLAGVATVVMALLAAADPTAAVRQQAGRAVGQRVATPSEVDVTGWPWVAAFGGLLTAGSGGLTLARGRAWPGMSGRYQRVRAAGGPAEAAEGPADSSAGGPGQVSGQSTGQVSGQSTSATAGLWDALDRGQDPTA